MTDPERPELAPAVAQPPAVLPPVALPPVAPPPVALRPEVARLTDGEWHRLHPASPLLKGGIALIAILGILIANLRERLINLVLPGFDEGGGDPVDYVIDHGMIGFLLLGALVLVIALIIGFYFSWRMHTFRITDEVVEVRSGILFRTNRKARLDRIQGINIVRPFIARLFGAAKLEVNQAGQDANVQLSYLSSAAADDLRREILRLASGTKVASAPAVAAGPGGVVDRRVHEMLAPELDPDAAPPESVVKIHPGRLIGSILLSGTTIFLVIAVGAATVGIVVFHQLTLLFAFIPAIIGFGSFYIQRITRSLRYSIASTPDGVRVGFGLLSTSNETLPPGRIHSVQASQPLLWRPFGWWEVKVNRASHSSTKGAAGEANTTILPVGDQQDVLRVLALLLPDLAGEGSVELLSDGMLSRGTEGDGFIASPRRAAWIRWFSWKRNGFAVTEGAVLLRKGAIWRELIIVPAPRVQSVSIERGFLGRMLTLASVHLHTVAGPINARLGAIDQATAVEFFGDTAALIVAAAGRDSSHRWRSEEGPVVEPATAAEPAAEAAPETAVEAAAEAAPEIAAEPAPEIATEPTPETA